MREQTGDWEGADHGHTYGLYRLAVMLEEAGDRKAAERLLQQAADHSSTGTLYHLAGMREEAGDREGAEALVLNAADRGRTDTRDIVKRLWPYGLDPDGTPTPPWQPSASAPLDRHVPPGTA
ncbi:hypothetical protein [Streptomyces mirabilis]